MRGAKLGKYSAYTWDRGRTVFVSGGFHSQILTPLDELAAPKLWTLPRDIQNPIRERFYDLLGSYSWPEKYAAQEWIATSTNELLDAKLDIAYDHDQLRTLAATYADICSRFSSRASVESFCQTHDVEPPPPKRTSKIGCLRRAGSIVWWTRRLFKRYARSAENGLRFAGFIARAKSLYASGIACRSRQRRAEILDSWIDRTIVRPNDGGDPIPLRTIRDGSTANPANRRRELMTRLRGMDELAEKAGLVADFYTLTLPSKYHAMLDGGGINPKFNRATVRDGQLQLRLLWSQFRARAAKEEIFYYGMRVAEPHHDGTPHWHMVLYSLESDRQRLRELLREYWLSEDGSEHGAAKHRITVMECNRSVGSAAGYLAKYIAKNIDGFEVGADFEADPGPIATDDDGIRHSHSRPDHGTQATATLEGQKTDLDATDTAKRVLTWAWLHGIRQFQFFGTAPVGLWRELRRLKDYHVAESAAIDKARIAADSGEWAAFVDAVGGVFVGRRTTISLWSERTGELNQYDELAGPIVVGIQAPEGYLRTRLVFWRLERAVTVSDTGPRAEKIGGGNPIGWSNPQETSMYGPH